jgi:hypothetical protein
MSEAEALFAVLAALYLIQCLHWLPDDAFPFRQTLFGRWRPPRAALHLSGLHRKAILANPLPPLGGVLACSALRPPLPVALSPAGVALPGGPLLEYAEFAKSLSVGGSRVFLRGSHSFALISNVAALHWTDVLGKLAKQPKEKRAATIERAIEALLDSGAIEERLAAHRQHAGTVRWHSNLLLVYLFLLAPALILWRGLSLTWPFLLAALLLQMWLIVWRFRRAHRQLYPADSETRFAATITIVLSPMAAMRAPDVLIQDLLSEFHPLAVARVVCAPAIFEPLAARTLREAFYPLPEEEDAGDLPEEAKWWEERWRVALKRFVEKHVGKTDAILGAPPPEDACRSYCPRCWSQYVVESGGCSDCGGLPLRPFPAGK